MGIGDKEPGEEITRTRANVNKDWKEDICPG